MENDRLEIEISSAEAEQKIDKLETQYNALKRSIKEKLVVDFTVNDMAAKVAAIKKNIPAISVDVQAHTDKSSIKTAQTIIDTSFEGVDVDVKPQVDSKASQKTKSDLDEISKDRSAKIFPKIDSKSLSRAKEHLSLSGEFRSSTSGQVAQNDSYQNSVLASLRSIYSEIRQMTKWIHEIYEGVLYMIRKTEGMDHELSQQTGLLRQLINKSFGGGDKNIYPELKRQTILLKQISSKGIAVTNSNQNNDVKPNWTQGKTKPNPRINEFNPEQVVAETFLRYLNKPKDKRIKIDGIDERDIARVYFNQDLGSEDSGVPIEDIMLKTGLSEKTIKQIQNKKGDFGTLIEEYQLAFNAMDKMNVNPRSDNRIARLATAFSKDVNQWGIDTLKEAFDHTVEAMRGTKETPAQQIARKNKAQEYKKAVKASLTGTYFGKTADEAAMGRVTGESVNKNPDKPLLQNFLDKTLGIEKIENLESYIKRWGKLNTLFKPLSNERGSVTVNNPFANEKSIFSKVRGFFSNLMDRENATPNNRQETDRNRILENQIKNDERIKEQWRDSATQQTWLKKETVNPRIIDGRNRISENQIHNQERLTKAWIDSLRDRGRNRILENQSYNNQKIEKEWTDYKQQENRNNVLENQISTNRTIPQYLTQTDRLGYEAKYSISEKYAQKRKNEKALWENTQLRTTPQYLNQTDRLGYEAPYSMFEKRKKTILEKGKATNQDDYIKSWGKSLKEHITPLKKVMDINAKVALGEKQVADYKKEQQAIVEKNLDKMSKEKGLLFDLLEKDKLRKEVYEDINEACKKKQVYIENDRQTSKNLQVGLDEETSKMKKEIQKQEKYIENTKRIKQDYEKIFPLETRTSKEQGAIDILEKRIQKSKEFIGSLKKQVTLQEKYEGITREALKKDAKLSASRLIELQEKHDNKLKTIQDFIDADKTTKSDSKDSKLKGYGAIDPVYRKGSVMGGGGGGIGGGSDYIDQVPQNPLLGRFAQWGMMASGFAATVFLIQMAGAQLANLMNIISTWEKGLLDIIDSTTLTGKHMEKLSDTIMSYASAIDGLEGKSMTIDQATQAYAAAAQYGIDPTKQNIHQLNALEYSSGVADYKEAAVIMAMAGTEFGDRMAESFSERWNISSGEGESSGSFTYEWEQMKSAGKGSLINLFKNSEAQYGKQLTDLMANISNWIQSNQPVIEGFVDSVAGKITVLFKTIQLALPGLIAFAGAFTLIHGSSLFIGFLTGVSAQIKTMCSLVPVATTALKGLSSTIGVLTWAMDGLKVALLATGPAILAMVAAWGVWKIGKHLYGIRKFKKELEEIRELNKLPDEKIANFSDDELNHYRTQTKNIISELKDREKKIKEQRAIAEKYTAAEDRTGYSIQTPAERRKNYFNSQKKSIQKDIEEISEFEARIAENKINANKMGLTFSSYVPATEQWKEGLQEINEELGVMPEKLKEVLIAEEKVANGIKNITQGIGFTTYKTYSEAFDRLINSNPETKSSWEVSLNREGLVTPGWNSFDEQLAKEKQIKADMEAELNNVPFASDRFHDLVGGLNTVNQKIKNLETKSATERTKNLDNAFKSLKDTVEDLNKTDFEKIVADIFRTHGDGAGAGKLIAKQRAILTKNLSDELAKLKGENLELPKELRDINQNASLPQEDADTLSSIKKNLEEINQLEIKINAEKEKGYQYSSDAQINYEKEINNLKAKNKHLLHSDTFTENERDRKIEYNNAKALIEQELNREKRKSVFAEWSSKLSGFTTEKQLSNTISTKQLEAADQLLPKDFDTVATEEQARIQAQINAYIDANERFNAAKSKLDFQKGLDNEWGAADLSDERIKIQEDYIEKRINLLKVMGVDEQTRERIRGKMLLDLERDLISGKESMWQNYYSRYNKMFPEHFAAEKQNIQDEYEINKDKYGEPTANRMQQEATTDLYNKNRVGLYSDPSIEDPLSKDLGQIDNNVTQQLMQEYQTLGEIIETSIGGAINGVVDATTAWITGTKSAKDAFKDMAYSVVTGLTQMIVKQTIYNALLGSSNTGGSSLGGSGGLIGMAGDFISGFFATGGVLSGSSISNYRNSVVSSPTLLPDSNIRKYATGTAMIGEAGPEAVMPLTRLPSGNLGVEASGANNNGGGMGNISVEMNITNKGQAVSAKQDGQVRWDAASKKMVIGIILEAAENNTGNFKSAMKMAVSS